MVVFDSDYRKAPEHPFPAAIEDAEDVIHYPESHPDQYDASNIFLSGFSAGGNLALVTASSLGPERIRCVIGIYPSVDLTHEHKPPEKRIDKGVSIPNSIRKFFYASYMLPGQSRSDPRISPIMAPVETFPKFVCLACGNADALHDPIMKLVGKLRESGHGEAESVSVDCQAHGFDKQAKDGTGSADKKQKIYDGAVDMINRALGAGGGQGGS